MRLLPRLAIAAPLVALAALFIATVTRPDIQDAAILTCYWLLLAGSWNLLAGFAGQFSFAHIALAVSGGYLTVLVERQLGLGPGIAILVAALLTSLAGFALGLISLRVRGIYLSLITFAFAGVFLVWATADAEHTRGYAGVNAEILFTGIDARPFLWLGLALVTAYFVCQSLILHGRLGLQAMAIRDREEVAEGLGVRTGRVKVAMFTITAFWAGAAGGFYAGYVGIVSPSAGQLIWMGWVIAMVVIGGMGSALGPIAGVLLVRFVDFEMRSLGSEYETLIFASLLVLFMMFMPNGLVGLGERFLERVRKPRQRWQDAPALDS